ncbi:hypothetical protein B566_EDAN006122 [Ephemera danica]|nr:hypothetical protein B566_EDAN006122 [Ephemera danica]
MVLIIILFAMAQRKLIAIFCAAVIFGFIVTYNFYLEEMGNVTTQLHQAWSTFTSKDEKLSDKNAKCETYVRPSWQGCPKVNQTLVTTHVDGRLGNLVFEYLGTWAVAQRFGLFPLMPNKTIVSLSEVFEDLSIPSFEEVFSRCPELGDLNTTRHTDIYASSRSNFRRALENARGTSRLVSMLVYAVVTEHLAPSWHLLPAEMRVRADLRDQAQHIIGGIANTTRSRDPKNKQKINFVGVHIRRTDYAYHMSVVHPNAELANASYYQHAMQWMRNKLSPQLVAFLVLSDDVEWCHENLNASDVFLPGNTSSPGLDMAILASCNHTILAYGTFALTAAMLAQGGYTIVFNTRNSTYTKVMEFASILPGWHIIDNDGKEAPEDSRYPLTFVG